jgi:AcrR family transcriptional regulator
MENNEQPTRQRILTEALTLFSMRGYDSVSVAEIAAAVGVKAPALYKHYRSKRDIFEAIVAEMRLRLKAKTASMQMDVVDASRDKGLFAGVSEEKLIEMGTDLFLYFSHDEYMCKFRKMLTIEQYGNKELAALYARKYMDEPVAYQEKLFELLIGSGVFVSGNARAMALHFYAPVFFLLLMCDCFPEREEEAIRMIAEHIKQFSRIYRKDNEMRGAKVEGEDLNVLPV